MPDEPAVATLEAPTRSSVNSADVALEKAAVIETPVAETPVVPETPTASETPEPSELDKLFAGIPEEQRTTVLDAFLAKLPATERTKLGTVTEILRDVDAQAEARGRAEAVRESVRVDYEKAIEASRAALEEAATSENWQKYEAAIAQRHDKRTADAVSTVVLNEIKALNGMKEAPQLDQNMVRALRAATDLPSYIAAWAKVIDAFAYNNGRSSVTGETEKAGKADEVIREQKFYESALSRLAAGERIEETVDDKGVKTYVFKKDDFPPSMAGVTSSSGGGRTVSWDQIQKMAPAEVMALPSDIWEAALAGGK